MYESKVKNMIDDIGGIFNISYYTKNYLVYKYKLSNKDFTRLLDIMEKHDVAFLLGDIIDEGLDKKTAYLLYRNNVQTIRELSKAYQYEYLFNIKGLGQKMLKNICYILKIN